MPPKHPQPLRLPAEPVPGALANPNCSTEMLAAALLLCRGSFTSALTLSPASRTASLPLNKRVQANPKAPRTRRGARPQPQGRSVVRGARGAGGAAGNLPFCHPPGPPRRPPTWSCGQFNQPSFPKLSQPARAIVTAGKNRQLLSGAALWGAPIHLFKQISKRAAALSSPLSSPGLTMG